MTKSDSSFHRQFKMKTISEITGLSPTLLRAWERRYKFLEPNRLPGGHRIYTEKDLKVLQRVQELLEAGHSVGEAAALGRESLLETTPSKSFSQTENALELAPTDLRVFCSSRFAGDGLGVSLRELSVSDLATVTQLYEAVKIIYELWLYMDHQARNPRLIQSRLEELRNPEFQGRIARLGASASNYSVLVRAAVEDTRWGALGPLMRHLEKADSSPEMLRTSILLARDQAKIMRNAFHDIDTALRSADASPKAHGIRGMVNKVSELGAGFETILDWEGSVSSRCLETSAVDRVLYDFLRRILSTESQQVVLWVGAINEELTRWAFRFEKPGFLTHSPSDLAAIAVSLSVGLTPLGAIENKYLGSGDNWAWFHWPIFEVHQGVQVCECEV